MDDAVGQRIRPHSADDRLTLATPAHRDAKDPVEQPDTQGRTTHHADTHSYALQAKSPSSHYKSVHPGSGVTVCRSS